MPRWQRRLSRRCPRLAPFLTPTARGWCLVTLVALAAWAFLRVAHF